VPLKGEELPCFQAARALAPFPWIRWLMPFINPDKAIRLRRMSRTGIETGPIRAGSNRLAWGGIGTPTVRRPATGGFVPVEQGLTLCHLG